MPLLPISIRAVSKDKALEPESVERYLANAFGEDLDDVTAAMRDLAKAVGKDELVEQLPNAQE